MHDQISERMSETNVTDQQKEILKQFRINLADVLTVHHTDKELTKWLRAKLFDLKKAEKYFRQIDLFQKVFFLRKNSETYEKPEVIQNHERTCFLGFSKEGSPIRYIRVNHDFYGFLHSVSQLGMIEFFQNFLEGDLKRMKERTLEVGQNQDGILFILDMDGYNYRDLAYKYVIETAFELIRLLQVYYPECWRYFLVINAPYVFYSVLFLFKPIIESKFMEKFKIASRSNSLELLREYIDDDLIPACHGGKRVDSKGDPKYEEFIQPYRKISEEYYLKNIVHLIKETDPGVTMVTIRTRSCYNIPLVVREAGIRIRLEFRTENGAIYFLLFYRPFGADPENPDLPAENENLDQSEDSPDWLLLKIKIQSHITPNDVTITAVQPGIYIFQFDNTFSWLGSKKLYFRVTRKSEN